MEDLAVSQVAVQDSEKEKKQSSEIALCVATYAKLPEKKRDRVNRLVELYVEAETESEQTEIGEAISEIIVPAMHGIKLSLPVQLEVNVPDRERKGVDAYFRKIGETIRSYREKSGMTQVELASKSGLPQSHICRLELGQHAPTPKTIERIAEALGVSPKDLDLLYDE